MKNTFVSASIRRQPVQCPTVVVAVCVLINATLVGQTPQPHPLSPVAGNEAMGIGYSGDGGPANKAQLSHPHGIAVDDSGNLFIADAGNGVIRKVSVDGTITTLDRFPRERPRRAGEFDYSAPVAIAVDSKGNIYVSDMFGVWKVDKVKGTSEIFAGLPLKPGYSGDGGPAKSAQLNKPVGLAIDDKGKSLHR